MAKQTKYGLGFSALSMKNAKQYGFVEEMVVDKNTGMHGIIVDSAKNVVSHEYLARTKYQLNTFVTRALQDNTIGKLYKITLNDYLVSMITNNSTNLITSDSNIAINNGATRMKGLRFNFDMDIFTPSNSSLFHFTDINIEIGMTLKIGSTSKNMKIDESLLAINTTAYAIDYSGLENATGDVTITINSIIVKPVDSFDYSKYKIALYDVLLIVI